jgi:hypothetical protein
VSSEYLNSLSERAFSIDVRDAGVAMPGMLGTVVEEETSEDNRDLWMEMESFPNDKS